MTSTPPAVEWITAPALVVNQPIGSFYVCVMEGSDLAEIAAADVRRMASHAEDEFSDYVGIQRPLNTARVKEIKAFVQTHDATFPSSILVSVSPEDMAYENGVLKIRRLQSAATVLDGQHRLAGFVGNPLEQKFEVIVTVFVGISYELQAHVFSTINTKQTKINPSLARDLLEFSSLETPEKVAHTFARHFHRDPNSPWYGLIKILGKKEDITGGTITQHAFVSSIVDLTYRDNQHNQLRLALQRAGGNRPALKSQFAFESQNYPFWPFYVAGKDNVTLKVLNNYFSAMKAAFPHDWGNPAKLLTKTTGYRAMMLGLRKHVNVGRSRANPTLSREFFDAVAMEARMNLEADGRDLTGDAFGSGEQAAVELREALWPTT